MKREIKTNEAPLPVAPYSQAVLVNNMLFISGQIGIDRELGKLAEGFEEQVKSIFGSIEAILSSAGFSKSDLVRLTVYLTEGVDFDKFNKLYEEFVRDINIKPARSTVIVNALPKGALVEIDAIAVRS